MSAASAAGTVAPAASGALVASGVVGGGLNASAGTVATPAYGGGASAPAIGVASMFQAVFGLAFVIALIFACAWLARRLGLNRPAQHGGLVKVVGSTALSQKERVVVVEIDDTWLVLGVAPGSVNSLHTMPAPAAADGKHATFAPAASPVSQFATDFRQRLAQKLGKPSSGADTDTTRS
ncbi:MAG: flagellar biosynthetic protein FliO [Pararobbsia sp.]